MDIDIDFPTNFDLNSVIKHAVPASMVKKGELVKHNCGYYLQYIPVDKHTGYAAIPFREAAQVGYFKMDFLHLSLLDSVKSKQELRQMIAKEPNWDLLQDPQVVDQLFQLNQQADILRRIKPRSVEELADTIAIIRPAKVYLIDRYTRATSQQRIAMRPELYAKPDTDKKYYKKSHAISYALTIVAQLHMIARGTA